MKAYGLKLSRRHVLGCPTKLYTNERCDNVMVQENGALPSCLWCLRASCPLALGKTDFLEMIYL